MSQVSLFAADVVMTPLLMSLTHNKMFKETYGRSLHYEDMHRNIAEYNILVVPSQVMG